MKQATSMSDLVPTSRASSSEPSRAEVQQPSSLREKTATARSKDDEGDPDDHHGNAEESVTGIKLALVVASVALACFLILLDTMVVSTVSCPSRVQTVFSQELSFTYWLT